jgi:hypothetical protein
MKILKYYTGRNYGKEQYLNISFAETDDYYGDVTATFDDPIRGIKGTVTLWGYETFNNGTGAAVLREYDAGRYNLL